MRRRLAAAASLVLLAAALSLAMGVAVENFPRGISVLLCTFVGVGAGWWGLVSGGLARIVGFGIALVAFAGAVALVLFEGRPFEDLIVIATAALALAAARSAFAAHARLLRAPRPSHAVLFYNPKSGGGKAARYRLADEARARGVEPVELTPGDDLVALVRRAIAAGADALAMAGGDGSQAIVAAEAAAHGIAYACIPAGTRNHFALDLGVDRDDVVGALDALVDGRERVVDLADVNGRVFVNNVSMGVYAEAVQRSGYRDAKLRTLAETAPQVLGPKGHGLDLRWTDAEGRECRSGAVLLVSNDPYRLGRALGAGTRPRLDKGLLGIAVLRSGNGDGGRHMSQWASETFEVGSGGPVAAGIDGEAARLEPPLRFRTRPGALRVLIAPHHPGASPSATMPATPWAAVLDLARLTAGRPASR